MKRRDVLTASIMTGGLAAQDKWVKPVVESIFLPAHAATTSSCDRAGLSFPGRSSSCPDFALLDEFYTIDDTIPCEPVITRRRGTDLDDPDVPFFSFAVKFSAGDFDRIGEVLNGSNFSDSQHARLLDDPPRVSGVCPTKVIESGGAFSFTVKGTSGLSFTASGSITATPGTITLSNIAIAPV